MKTSKPKQYINYHVVNGHNSNYGLEEQENYNKVYKPAQKKHK